MEFSNSGNPGTENDDSSKSVSEEELFEDAVEADPEDENWE